MGRAIVLMYHNVGVPPREAKLRGLYVSPLMFRFQMWYLAAAGFRVVPLREIVAFTEGHFADQRLAAVTFDDGYQDFHDHAYPILKRHGYPSTVFIVSRLAGGENLWDYKNVGVRKRLMDWETIARLADANVEFGSHTVNHAFLRKITDGEVEQEVTESKRHIEERLSRPADFFCYPYGDFDNRTVAAVRRAGYRGAVSIFRGLVHPGDDPFTLRRSIIRYSTNPFLFAQRLHGSYEDSKGGRS